MFTQCSKCETVFRLSAEVLRAAGGQVRCGRCGEVFNALARLAEDATTFPKGESPLELEARADAILQSVEPVPPAETPASGPELARLVVLAPNDAPESDGSLEFTLPPGELDRIFVETSPAPLQILAASLKPVPHAQSQDDSAPRTDSAPRSGTISGLSVPEAVRREMLAGLSTSVFDSAAPLAPADGLPSPADELLKRRPRVPFAAWVIAAVALAGLLLLQISRIGGGWPSRATGKGSAATLSSYQLRQWGVTGDPAAKGTLRVRASILNASAQLLPYPLLRVTLADRFGTKVGQRDFQPAEYLGKAPLRMLGPGERADSTLDILDPGKDAEGFEIDVCVRAENDTIACAGDAAAAAK